MKGTPCHLGCRSCPRLPPAAHRQRAGGRRPPAGYQSLHPQHPPRRRPQRPRRLPPSRPSGGRPCRSSQHLESRPVPPPRPPQGRCRRQRPRQHCQASPRPWSPMRSQTRPTGCALGCRSRAGPRLSRRPQHHHDRREVAAGRPPPRGQWCLAEQCRHPRWRSRRSHHRRALHRGWWTHQGESLKQVTVRWQSRRRPHPRRRLRHRHRHHWRSWLEAWTSWAPAQARQRRHRRPVWPHHPQGPLPKECQPRRRNVPRQWQMRGHQHWDSQRAATMVPCRQK